MALSEKPHSVTVTGTITDHDGDGIDTTPELLAGTTVDCQITPMDPSEAFTAAGEMITRPHWCLMDLEDEPYFVNGAKVTYGTRIFYVLDTPIRFEQGNDCDHASVKLTEDVRTAP